MPKFPVRVHVKATYSDVTEIEVEASTREEAEETTRISVADALNRDVVPDENGGYTTYEAQVLSAARPRDADAPRGYGCRTAEGNNAVGELVNTLVALFQLGGPDDPARVLREGLAMIDSTCPGSHATTAVVKERIRDAVEKAGEEMGFATDWLSDYGW